MTSERWFIFYTLFYFYFLSTGLWKLELEENREKILLNDKMSVRLEMFSEAAREGAVSALRGGGNISCGSAQDPLMGITGNFRKLEVD